jgi:hypothetical protein
MDFSLTLLGLMALATVLLVAYSIRSVQRSEERIATILERIEQNQGRMADHTRHIAELAAEGIKLATLNTKIAEGILRQFREGSVH